MRINQLEPGQPEKEGAFIKARMAALGVSQEELADEMGLTQGTISKYWKGSKPIPPERLFWLAGRLDFDAIELRPSLVKYIGVSDLSGQKQIVLAKKIAKFMAYATPEDLHKLSAVLDAFLIGLLPHQDKQ